MILYEILSNPYSETEIQEKVKENKTTMDIEGWIEGNLLIPLETIIKSDRESFLDYLSEHLIAEGALSDIEYGVLPHTGERDEILIRVGGFYENIEK